jgi:hypothetical protein
MHMTAHIDARMNQRGIKRDLIELAMNLGHIEGDRYVLTANAIHEEIRGLRRQIKTLDEALKKGGVTVVAEGAALITAYRTNSYNAKLARKK